MYFTEEWSATYGHKHVFYILKIMTNAYIHKKER